MTKTSNDWLVIYRVRFSKVIDSAITVFEPPKDADIWRFGPENVSLDEHGLPVYRSSVWGGFGSYKDYETAEKAALEPTTTIPFIKSAEEVWSALLVPASHKGDVNWRGEVESSSAIQVNNATVDHITADGYLVVITSAGFNSQEITELPRIANFTTSSEKVRKDFEQQKGNIRSSIFYAMHDLMDGITITLWDNLEAMRRAAYGAGFHGDLIKSHQQSALADRISNTRAHVILSQGSWDGTNPLQTKNSSQAKQANSL